MGRAVIFVRPYGPSAEQQHVACLDHCHRRGYRSDSLCHRGTDAAALVEAGEVDVVVTAYDEPDDAGLIQRIAAAGGRLEYVRTPARPPRQVVEVDQVAVRLAATGASPETIADILGRPVQEIRVALSRSRSR